MYSIYLVDDEPFVIESLKKIIEKMTTDFKVVGWSYAVARALDQVKKCEPDLLITDIKMPGASGLELIEEIGRIGLKTTTIVVSGFDDFQYVRQAFLLGAEDYVLKPVVPAKFVSLLGGIKVKLDNRGEEQTLTSKAHEYTTHFENLSEHERLVASVCEYLDQNISGENSINNICSRFSISQPVLSKLFKKYLHSTYNEYLTTIRIERAKFLLKNRQDMLISTIADQTGYANQYYFSNVFKQAVGVSPSEFRNSNV